MKIDGYLIEECWDFYYLNRGEEDIEANKKWLHVDWQPCWRKKCYKTKEVALDAIKQMSRNGSLCFNHKFRLIPIYKGEPEIIELQLK